MPTATSIAVAERKGAYARARSFYRACGYDEEAPLRDLRAPADDMVLFRKALTSGG